LDVVTLSEADPAARDATALVPKLKRPSYCRRNRARAGTDLDHTSIDVVAHDHPRGVAGKPLRRSGRNAHATLGSDCPG